VFHNHPSNALEFARRVCEVDWVDVNHLLAETLFCWKETSSITIRVVAILDDSFLVSELGRTSFVGIPEFNDQWQQANQAEVNITISRCRYEQALPPSRSSFGSAIVVWHGKMTSTRIFEPFSRRKERPGPGSG